MSKDPVSTDGVIVSVPEEWVISLRTLDEAEAHDFRRADYVHGRPLGALYEELKTFLGDEIDEYFSKTYTIDTHTRPDELKTRGFGVLSDETKLQDVRYRWISVFPVTGGNEGHYVHVDLIWQSDYREGRVPLFLAKTFQGHAHAVKLAGTLARVLGV